MRNVDSRNHSFRFDCCVFLFYSFSAVTFATQSATSRHRNKSDIEAPWSPSGPVVSARQRRPAQGRRPCHPHRDGWAKLGHDDGAGDEQVWRHAAQPLYLGNDFELASFCIVSGPALHLDNTFLENDYPQLSCLA
jgi:hypothetical protein